jgi:uncharacterized protein (DUF1810 family)
MRVDANDHLEAHKGALPNTGTYDDALAEMRAGKKKTHWIWYIFPILAGLRASSTAARFALKGPDAAVEYLQHPVLRQRLTDVVRAVHGHVVTEGKSLMDLMSDPVDAKKVVSCCTLFAPIAAAANEKELAAMCKDIVDVAVNQQGFAPCELTGIVLQTWNKSRPA